MTELATSRETTTRSRLSRELRTIPNLLSLSRIALFWAGAILYLYGHPVIGLGFGVAAAISDYLDGYLARRWGQVTELGGILDRLSDLIMECTGFVVSVHYQVFSPLFFLAYLLREFVVLSARAYASSRNYTIQSSYFGKLKTNFIGWGFLVIYLALADVVPIAGAQLFLERLGMVGIVGGLVWSYLAGWKYVSGFVAAYNADRR